MYKNKKIKVGAYTLKVFVSGRVKLPRPKAVKAATLKALGGKKLLFSYAQGAKGDMNGYQIQYSYSKRFAKSATSQMAVAKALNKTRTKTVGSRTVAISGLKKGKTCYVRVRAYRKYGGITVYGKFSKALKTKVK
jgi:hypothetical protein